jgi:hypothetical protein
VIVRTSRIWSPSKQGGYGSAASVPKQSIDRVAVEADAFILALRHVGLYRWVMRPMAARPPTGVDRHRGRCTGRSATDACAG